MPCTNFPGPRTVLAVTVRVGMWNAAIRVGLRLREPMYIVSPTRIPLISE